MPDGNELGCDHTVVSAVFLAANVGSFDFFHVLVRCRHCAHEEWPECFNVDGLDHLHGKGMVLERFEGLQSHRRPRSLAELALCARSRRGFLQQIPLAGRFSDAHALWRAISD